MADQLASSDPLEAKIQEWRAYVSRRRTIQSADVDELEDHLRSQVGALIGAGLSSDEAFLVGVKRMGALDAISHEFAREHSDRLWKQLVLSSAPSESAGPDRREMLVAFGLAVAAGASIKVPELFGLEMMAEAGEEDVPFYLRNASFFVLPFLAGYFVWKRSLSAAMRGGIVAAFAVAMVFANAYPFVPFGSTEVLSVIHLPIALWLVIGVAYAGGQWGDPDHRMDFVRYSGEAFIYYVLIALGGGVLVGFTGGLFQAIGVDPETLLGEWVVPCCALGAVIVASWLVEAKQGVIETMAPMLTRIFTPLFALMLLGFLATMAWTGQGIDVEREALIAFDLLLAVVIGLLLYSISARDPSAPPNTFDVVSVILVASALVANAFALAAITQRISEFGFTPNRVAALGENLILLANLAWSVVLYVRFLRSRGPFRALERWQLGYLPVYAAWAAIVVVVFPPLFGWI